MNKFRNFMKRSSGKWNSQRRYIYTDKNVISNLKSDLSVDFVREDDNEFQVDLKWKTFDEKGKVISKGEMITIGNEEELKRNVAYMSEEPTLCKVNMVDDDCVVFDTTYSGMRFREEIRLVENDTIRLRQTLGWKKDNKTPFLCGQYLEQRK